MLDVQAFSDIYDGDTSGATSMVFAMLCQNYQPGDSAMAGIGIGTDLFLALDGNGGVELRVSE